METLPVMTEDKLQIKCKICFSEFESVSKMDLHFQLCKKTLVCDKCDKEFEDVESIEEHIDICNSKKLNISVQFVESVLMMMLLVLVMKESVQEKVQENSYVRTVTRNLAIGNCY